MNIVVIKWANSQLVVRISNSIQDANFYFKYFFNFSFSLGLRRPCAYSNLTLSPGAENFYFISFPSALCADVVREVWPEGLFGRTKIWRVTIGARPRKKEKKSKVIFKKQSCRLADTVNTGWNTKPPQKIWAVFSARQVVSINTIRCVTCRLLLRFSHRHPQKKEWGYTYKNYHQLHNSSHFFSDVWLGK